ncbi:hypothetical protein [Parasitella parasitica]|uniref:Uncharacterized protein n=1 Tax=Parasitella parasitica TaxID=35722 RepID=A0A0B7N2L2_9FUNG|nr:hypothetical protein [Parasitella parasitica]
MTVNKRPLPPTPTSPRAKYTYLNDSMQPMLLDTNIDNILETERRWNIDLNNCYKALEQKESIICNLKTLVMEWKRKAMDYENSYKTMKQKLEAREQFLIKQHQAEIEAITKSQTDQVNEHLELILELEKENRALMAQQGHPQEEQQQLLSNSNSLTDIYKSSTTQLCNEAQVANQLANESVVCNKDDSDHLIQSINEMVNEMEGTLHELKNYCDQDEVAAPITTPPALISDASYSSSDESTDEAFSLPPAPVPQQQPSKKRSIRNSFLFLTNNSKKTHEDIQRSSKRKSSLSETHRFQRKPSKATSLIK